METRNMQSPLVLVTAVFSVLALLAYVLGDVSARTPLKEGISLLTLVAFFQMAAQFYTTRWARRLMNECSMGALRKIHRFVGYLFSVIIMMHPLLIVFPRYFESGIAPGDALITMVTNTTAGSLTGMTAWILLAVLVSTSVLRRGLPMRYATWRTVHGALSLFFIVFASYHVIDQGRHITPLISKVLVLVIAGGISLYLQAIIPGKKVKQEVIA